MDPAFVHYSTGDLPQLEQDGATVTVIIGEAYGQRSPVTTYSSMLYLECRIPKGATLTLPDAYPEIAAYVVAGDIHIEQESYQSGAMAVAAADQKVSLHAAADSHVTVIGGAPLGKRHI